jgi:hypothetical protein
MADDTSPGGAPIEALLQERTRFQQWLAKLDSSAGSAPAAVRAKVRADYQGRLQAVIEQLKSHADTIRSALDRHQGEQKELAGRRFEAEEALAEAEVRHLVGEYADDAWDQMRAQTTQTIESLQAELERVGKEIERLMEVQGFIAEPPPPEPEGVEPEALEPEPVPIAELEPAGPRPAPPIEMLPDPTPDFAAAAGSPQSLDAVPDFAPAAPGAPRFVPKPAVEPARGRPPVAAPAAGPRPAAVPADELAFLKSVAGDDRRTAPRRSGETARPETPPEPAVTTAAPQPSAKPGQASQAKTLKCGECGTLNRPTEWYCERCGAELAAL